MRDFSHSVDVLVKAYMNDTLTHGNDCACAVGNLIAHELGVNPKSSWNPEWLVGYVCGVNIEDGRREIETTGYTVNEILRIERAFENVLYSNDHDEWNYKGLMAVVDVLADIHEIDLTTREESKKLFVKV